MKSLLLLAPLALLACTQDPAPVDYQGHVYHSQNGDYDSTGTEMPKYSASNPAPMPDDQAQKYQSSQRYGSPAEFGSVSSSDLPPPPAAQAVDSGVSRGSAPPGEISVPVSAAPRTQALVASGANGSAPFGSSSPTPPPSSPAPAGATVMAVPVAPLNPASPPAPVNGRVTAGFAPSSSPTPLEATKPALEPDYYAQEAAAAAAAATPPASPPKVAAPSDPDASMMASDETEPTQAAPAPASGQPDFIWPVKGAVLSGFGAKSGGKSNDGINIKGLKGDPIRAAADGKVTYAGSDVKALGNMVIVDHGGGWVSTYAHASELLVKKGQSVVKSQLLGYVGNSGSVSDPQLHFTVRHNNTPVDPKAVLVAD